MPRKETGNDRDDERPDGAGFVGMPCCTGAWPGQDTAEPRTRACPCTGWLRRHRRAACVALAAMGLAFVGLQVAWILGVVAFFRTL